MDDKEFEERIRQLHDPRGSDIAQVILENKFFIEQSEYADIKKAFRSSKYHQHGWKWHQLVRIILEPPEIRQYMHERLLNLILKHRRSYDEYFELKTEEGKFQIPNPIADLNRLEILVRQYIEIYHELTSQIQVDYLKSKYSGSIIRGRINWHKTIRNSATEFPLTFVTTLKEMDFITPENILLVLCAEWMYRESSRLLQIEFAEPLSDYSRNLLTVILEKTKVILQQFPFNEVLNASKKFWTLSYYDPRIQTFEYEALQRIKQGLVHNIFYKSLLIWINKFRELNIPHVSANTPTRHILESIVNLDTVYEAWIFLEFVEYLHEKGILLDFHLRDQHQPHCKFSFDGQVVSFWYEKTFTKFGGNAWVLEHKPDFTAMLDNKILAVFDAKNYAKSSDIVEAQNKMLAYMTNLDINFGALIFSNHPGYWDDFNKSQKAERLRPILAVQYHMNDSDSLKISKELANLQWNELPDEYSNIFPPKHVEKFESQQSGMKTRYHLDQT